MCNESGYVLRDSRRLVETLYLLSFGSYVVWLIAYGRADNIVSHTMQVRSDGSGRYAFDSIELLAAQLMSHLLGLCCTHGACLAEIKDI